MRHNQLGLRTLVRPGLTPVLPEALVSRRYTSEELVELKVQACNRFVYLRDDYPDIDHIYRSLYTHETFIKWAQGSYSKVSWRVGNSPMIPFPEYLKEVVVSFMIMIADSTTYEMMRYFLVKDPVLAFESLNPTLVGFFNKEFNAEYIDFQDKIITTLIVAMSTRNYPKRPYFAAMMIMTELGFSEPLIECCLESLAAHLKDNTTTFN